MLASELQIIEVFRRNNNFLESLKHIQVADIIKCLLFSPTTIILAFPSAEAVLSSPELI